MKAREIRRFFEDLNRRIDEPVEIMLTGGAAAVLWGVERATYDIDFEVRFKRVRSVKTQDWEALQKAIAETGRATGITPQFDEDIDRWNAISLPAKSSRRYALIGKVDVRQLDPGLWAIGKLTRFIATDIEDLRTVLKTVKTNARGMVQLWGVALGISPASNTQPLFRRQVESFLDLYAREIWGSKINPEILKQHFLAAAQKASQTRRRGSGGAGSR